MNKRTFFKARQARAATSLACLLALLLFSACTLTQRQDSAAAGNGKGPEPIEEKIARLQRAIDETKAQAAKSAEQSPNLTKRLADLGNQVEEVSANLRSVMGRLDELEKISSSPAPPQQTPAVDAGQIKLLENEITALKNRIELLEAEPKRYAAETETKTAAETPPVKPPKEIPSPEEPKPSKARSAQDMYDEAYTAYKKGKHETARKLFSEYIRQYPDSDLVDNAYYWTGESFYDQGKYEEAILQYDNIVQKFKKSEKVPSALLKEAYAFRAINDSAAAKSLLEKLLKEHKGSEQAAIARKVLDLISP